MKTVTRFVCTSLAVALVWAVALAPDARAQSVADFYKGKKVRVIVGFSSGGGYSKYCFLLVQYLAANIPGKPNLTCQFMKGSGGVKAANFMYNAGPRDGSALGMLSDVMTVSQLLRPN